MNKEDENKLSKPTNANSNASKKVFDVMRPGKAPASATSRPVIVGHKAQVKENMFVPSSGSRFASDNPFDKHNLMSHGKEMSLDDKVSDSSKDASPKSGSVEKLTAGTETPLLPEKTEEKQKATQSDESTDDVVSHEEIVFDDLEPGTSPAAEASVVSETESAYKKDTKPAVAGDLGLIDDTPAAKPEKESVDADISDAVPAEFRQTNEVTSMQDDSKPVEVSSNKPLTQDDIVAATGAPMLDHAFVSHHKAHTKWWEWMLIFLLIVVIGLVALNFLIDAEVISLNLDLPHTNLIK
jgi:hypothetical protein